MYMNRLQRGLTVIELLVVIVVIGILAGIIVTVYSTTGSAIRNKARETDVRTWAAAFETYKARFSVYPALPTGDGALNAQYLCLGSFTATSSKCVQYGGAVTKYLDATSSATTTMLTNVAKNGTTPVNSGAVVKSAAVGPFLWISQTDTSGTKNVTAKFIDFFENSCPSSFTDETSNSDATLVLLFAGLPSGAKACSLTQTFTYTPS